MAMCGQSPCLSWSSVRRGAPAACRISPTSYPDSFSALDEHAHSRWPMIGEPLYRWSGQARLLSCSLVPRVVCNKCVAKPALLRGGFRTLIPNTQTAAIGRRCGHHLSDPFTLLKMQTRQPCQGQRSLGLTERPCWCPMLMVPHTPQLFSNPNRKPCLNPVSKPCRCTSRPTSWACTA